MDKLHKVIENPGGGVILLGKEGTGVFPQALKLAEDIANFGKNSTIPWKNHNDIHVIDIIDGKRDITLNQLFCIWENKSLVPMYARVNVYVIGHADCMNIYVQNALLKVLEDGYSNNIIIMCCENRPMDTVCNRCTVIPAGRSITQAELKKFSSDTGFSEGLIKATVNDRYEWLEHMSEKGSLTQILKMVDSLRTVKESRELIFSLSAMAEGNRNFIKSSDVVEQLSLFYGMEAIFFDAMNVEIKVPLKCINEEEANKLRKIYSPSDIVIILQEIIRTRERIKNKTFTLSDYNQVILYLARRIN